MHDEITGGQLNQIPLPPASKRRMGHRFFLPTLISLWALSFFTSDKSQIQDACLM